MTINRKTSDKILNLSNSLGADSAEVFMRSANATTVEIKGQEVDAFDRAKDRGAGLRVIIGGRMGFAFTTDFSEAALKILAQAAITNAKNSEPDPFNSIPARSVDYRAVSIYDPAIAALSEKEKIERVSALEREAFAIDPRIKRIRKASASFSESETMIANTNGAEVSYRSTACSASIEVVAEDKGESQAGWEFDSSRHYARLDVEEVGRSAARKALGLLGAKSVESVKAPVVLDNRVAEEILSIMSSGFSSENAQKKKSLFIGMLGREVVSPLLTVHDDGLYDGGMGTYPCDDEAVPTRKKTVIENGRLMMFLHNTYTAKKDNAVSTGNGMRGGFKGVPGVGVTNLFIAPGKHSLEDLIVSAGRGFYVTEIMGTHTANPISGDFSVGATGFWIEKGKIAYPVREVAIAGNILDLMKNVVAVGRDLKFSGRTGSPSLLIKELSIGGK